MDTVIDDIKQHIGSKVFPSALGCGAASTHLGFYFGWAIERGMLSNSFVGNHRDVIASFSKGEVTGPHIIRLIGGSLWHSFLNEELGEFSERYCKKPSRFILDYVHLFSRVILDGHLHSMYQIVDNYENQRKVSRMLDVQFAAWRTYPPAADMIFDGHEVGMGSYYPLDMVTQATLLSLARALIANAIAKPVVVFLTSADELRSPQIISLRGRRVEITTVDGTEVVLNCLREGLARETIKAFAIARQISSTADNVLRQGFEVIAQHVNSGPHRIFAPYRIESDNMKATFEKPQRGSPIVDPNAENDAC